MAAIAKSPETMVFIFVPYLFSQLTSLGSVYPLRVFSIKNSQPSHTFSMVDFPSSPAGLNRRIKIRMAKAMASR